MRGLTARVNRALSDRATALAVGWVALLLLTPAPAQASRIDYFENDPQVGGDRIRLLADPGEANVVAVAAVNTRVVSIIDPLLNAQPGFVNPAMTKRHCVLAPALAVCHPIRGLALAQALAGVITGVEVELGDGNDTAAGSVVLSGGAIYRGGAGNDRINGADGTEDTVAGGPGADDISGGDGESDRSQIPVGRDVALYNGADGPVTVTLDDVANDGTPGEGDNVHSDFESIVGSAFDDVLIGTALGDDLSGGPGADTLRGGAGQDFLAGDPDYGSSGADRIEGGPGHDVLVGAGGNDDLEGGPGPDFVYGDRGDDRLDIRDNERDEAWCDDPFVGNDGFDVVIADPADELHGVCEDVRRD